MASMKVVQDKKVTKPTPELTTSKPNPDSNGKGETRETGAIIGTGTTGILDTAKIGAFLQESTRSIPSNLTLKIGLDPSLGNEASLAQQALAGISRIEALPLQQEEVQYYSSSTFKDWIMV